MVPLVHHFCPFLRDGCAEWRTWCTILALFRGMAVLNGARGAPYLSFLAGWLCRMARVVHHFGSFSWDGGAEWCLWCTIFVLFAGWRHRMVHVVHHICPFWQDGCAEWRTWCTILALFRGMAALNGASGAPFMFLLVGWLCRMAHVVHQFSRFLGTRWPQTHQPSTSDALSFLAPVLPHCLPRRIYPAECVRATCLVPFRRTATET